MPRGKSKNANTKGTHGKTPAKVVKWVNVKLDVTDEPQIIEYGLSRDNLLLDFAEVSVRGGDFGVKWTDDGQTVMAYVIVDDAEVAGQRVGLSGYADNAIDAMLAVMFKLHVKLDGLPTAGSDDNKPKFG